MKRLFPLILLLFTMAAHAQTYPEIDSFPVRVKDVNGHFTFIPQIEARRVGMVDYSQIYLQGKYTDSAKYTRDSINNQIRMYNDSVRAEARFAREQQRKRDSIRVDSTLQSLTRWADSIATAAGISHKAIYLKIFGDSLAIMGLALPLQRFLTDSTKLAAKNFADSLKQAFSLSNLRDRFMNDSAAKRATDSIIQLNYATKAQVALLGDSIQTLDPSTGAVVRKKWRHVTLNIPVTAATMTVDISKYGFAYVNSTLISVQITTGAAGTAVWPSTKPPTTTSVSMEFRSPLGFLSSFAGVSAILYLEGWAN